MKTPGLFIGRSCHGHVICFRVSCDTACFIMLIMNFIACCWLIIFIWQPRNTFRTPRSEVRLPWRKSGVRSSVPMTDHGMTGDWEPALPKDFGCGIHWAKTVGGWSGEIFNHAPAGGRLICVRRLRLLIDLPYPNLTASRRPTLCFLWNPSGYNSSNSSSST